MAEILQFKPNPSDSDHHARDQALDTRKSFIVEAPAGSGKTGLLLQRYLKLLIDPSTNQPEEILAITFTRKATAELRHRILSELESAWTEAPLTDPSPFATVTRNLAQEVLLRDAQLGWSVRQNPTRLRIRTIDSVCVEIASSLPLLSGGAVGRKATEDADPLYQQAARRTLMQLGGPDTALNEALRTALLHRDGSLFDVEHLLSKMLAAREQWAELVPLNRESLTDAYLDTVVRLRLERTLENIVCAGLTRATHALAPNVINRLAALAHRLSIEPGYKGADSPIAFCASRQDPPGTVAEHLDHWVALIDLLFIKDGGSRRSFAINHLGFTLPKYERPELESLIAESSDEPIRHALCAVRDLPPAKYPDAQWHVAKALFRLLLHGLAELKVIFAESGECDFAEFSLAARDALRSETGPADLTSSAGTTLRHLLVDEMQDTSASQYELIQTLTQTWDGHSQTVFLVGDPKQSIYLFRQARVERFLRTIQEERLGDVPLNCLQLNSNFRSQKTLVESFNHSFETIFPHQINTASGEAIDVPFVTAFPARSPSDADGTLWHTAILPTPDPENPSDNPTHIHSLEEARTIRQVIEFWQAKPLPTDRTAPWTIAILARARHHLAPIVAEFQRNDPAAGVSHIPFRAVKIEPLNERAEVLDAFALTRALQHPADRTAWLAVLHAPWCGLGLADLLALTGGDESPDATIHELVQTRSQYLSSEGQILLHRAWPTLQEAALSRGRSTLSMHVVRTWACLGGDAALQPDQLANVQRFFALLQQVEQPGAWLDLRDLDRQLKNLYAESPAIPGAVDLMTIHAAKGLEWDVVLVPALERKGQASRPELLNWLELDVPHDDDTSPSSVVLAPIASKGSKPDPLYQWLNKVRGARETAERKRLFYVACTRAREELHLFAAARQNIKGDLINPARDSLLAACWPAAVTHFSDLPSPQSSGIMQQMQKALRNNDSMEDDGLALAASAPSEEPPLIHRLPLTYNPIQRFLTAAEDRLPCTPASALKQSPTFDRPEGSFAVRAFGNVVHRYLQVLANRLASTADTTELQTELQTWQPRLLASLRGEGLAPAIATRESGRALEALTRALADPIGLWLLSPKPSAATESALAFASGTLRVDRTFLAASDPLEQGTTHTWIVDFKTTEQGSRTPDQFEAQERAKYTAQLETYATARRALSPDPTQIILALYYPLIPRLISWPA